ncbi:MAG: ArnT family glycosyltransferase, partial [Thermoplasmatota archaeon]
MHEQNGTGTIHGYLPYAAVLLLSAIIRFVNLMNPFGFPGYSGSLGNNGTDEGVFLMTGRLVSSGYRMYSDVNTQQGPLFSFALELLQGDPLQVRMVTVVLSLAGVLGIMLFSGRLGGGRTALASSLFLGLNYVFFKESRHASSDLFSTVFLIFAFYAMLIYFRDIGIPRGRGASDQLRTAGTLLLAGIVFALAAMSKLFAVVPLLSMGIFMLVQSIRCDRGKGIGTGIRIWHIMVLAGSACITTFLLMNIYGFGNTLDGMLLDNLHRPGMTLVGRTRTVLLFLIFTSLPAILSLFAVIRERREIRTQLMLVWAIPLFIFIIVQSPVWEHYLVLVLPPLCYLGGRGFDLLVHERAGSNKRGMEGTLERKKSGRSRVGSFLLIASILFLRVPKLVHHVDIFVLDVFEHCDLLIPFEDFSLPRDHVED